MKSIKLSNGRLNLRTASAQIEGDRRHLLGLLASCDSAAKTLEKKAALLSESRRLIFEAERLLSMKR
jgi:hypothetical protein